MNRQFGTALPEDYALRSLNRTIGTQDLCAWLVTPGICWVQTKNPRHAARLVQRSDTRLVVWGVVGGYLRTFEVQKPLSWAKKLISRYQTAETHAGRGMEGHISARVKPGGCVEASGREEHRKSPICSERVGM